MVWNSPATSVRVIFQDVVSSNEVTIGIKLSSPLIIRIMSFPSVIFLAGIVIHI